jgi:tRNA threonylcarbamoyladenosine biosynthesis protein TsaE
MISKNIQETEKIAKIFLDKILKRKNFPDRALVVALSGDLGAGKTIFTQAVGKHLGIKNKIASPTFVLIKKYSIPLPLLRGSARRARGSHFKFLFHLDAYRLKNEKELLQLGWEEIIGNKDYIIFIEWPENVRKIIPANARFVYISHLKNNQRKLELK